MQPGINKKALKRALKSVEKCSEDLKIRGESSNQTCESSFFTPKEFDYVIDHLDFLTSVLDIEKELSKFRKVSRKISKLRLKCDKLIDSDLVEKCLSKHSRRLQRLEGKKHESKHKIHVGKIHIHELLPTVPSEEEAKLRSELNQLVQILDTTTDLCEIVGSDEELDEALCTLLIFLYRYKLNVFRRILKRRYNRKRSKPAKGRRTKRQKTESIEDELDLSLAASLATQFEEHPNILKLRKN